MVKKWKDWFSAEIYKSYLYCSARVIRNLGGSITAYDGDRVMAVFIGDGRNSSAAKCALQINYVTQKILVEKFVAKYPNADFSLRQRVGVDASKLFIARTGIRGTNDLVWVGNAANNAAKMAALDPAYPSYVTAVVYEDLIDNVKFGGDPRRNMWTDLGAGDLGYRIYGSAWNWSV
ncbi:hypothetical protein LX90_002326 [Lentzea flava]|nr:hypothetical protein [Lentzea flava]